MVLNKVTDSPIPYFSFPLTFDFLHIVKELHLKAYFSSDNTLYWGKGIMPKAIQEIVAYGFATFDIVRIYARPFSTNSGSQRVLEKAGFELEARLKKALYKNDEYLDELIYVKFK